MKPLLSKSFALPALAFAVACSQAGVTNPGGGAGASSGGAASGGSPSGGSPSAAGATNVTAGAPGDGTSGAPAASGAGGASTAGADTGTAGAGTGTAGSGTSAAGAAGKGSGGSGGTGTGAGGTAGSGVAGGSGGAVALTPASFAGIKNKYQESMVSSFILMPCYSQAAQDCITNDSTDPFTPGGACPNQNASLPMEQQGRVTKEYFTAGGDIGKMYNVTIKVTGISEAKYYMGGTRAAGNGVLPNANDPAGVDTFYTGGTPVNVENYNIYKITVRMPPAAGAMPGTGTELQHYYLNSFPQTATPYEDHESFPLNFTHDIPVPGGGEIEYLTADRNCHAIDNCGPGFHGTACPLTAARSLPSDPGLMVPANYMGTPVSALNKLSGAAQPYHSQLLHIVVTAVAAM